MRIAEANKSFGPMKSFFERPEVNIYYKYMIFVAIQMNLLLWGCESWALHRDLLNKLERVVNQKVRKILNINLWHVKGQRITILNSFEKSFNNISSVQTLIDTPTMQFLGKLAQNEISSPLRIFPCLRQLLIAYILNPQHFARPLKSNIDSMVESLQQMLKDIPGFNVDHKGSLKD